MDQILEVGCDIPQVYVAATYTFRLCSDYVITLGLLTSGGFLLTLTDSLPGTESQLVMNAD